MVLVESFSGIRGIYGLELSNDIAKKYAYAYFTEFLKSNSDKTIVIGIDTRPNNKEIYSSMISCLDCNIINIETSPTPIIEHAVRAFNADGGIIISGSHNEPEFTGIKFLDNTGAVINPTETKKVIDKLHEIKDIDISIVLSNQKITNKKTKAIQEYKKLIKSLIGNQDFSKYKIIVDPNGGAGTICKEIYKDYNINVKYINMDKGKFNRLVEPNKNSLKSLANLLDDTYEFAAGFDCDADRVEIVMNNKEFISGNHILAIITDEILKTGPKFIVVNDATSYLVKDIAKKHRAEFIEVNVGETNVVNKMSEVGAIIGGEGSNGGVIISPGRCRDGILAILYLLKIIDKNQKPLLRLIKELPEYYYIKEKIKLTADFSVIEEKLTDYYKNKGYRLSKVGGLKFIDQDNSWIWFRESKTEHNSITIISDSKNKIKGEDLIKEGKELLNQFKSVV